MGKLYRFHNDVDTDQIIASQYLLFPTIDEMKTHTFESLDSGLCQQGKTGRLCCCLRKLWLRFIP